MIQAFDITKLYRELGYSSLFEYLVKEVGYSESSAQRRISSARLIKQVPEIGKDVKSGVLNLTQVSMAYTALRQEEKALGETVSRDQKQKILEKLKSKNTFETQKVLLQELPHFEPPKPKASLSQYLKVCVTMEMPEADWEKVKALLAHYSHSVPDQKLESLLLYFANQVEKKNQSQTMKSIETQKPPRELNRLQTRTQALELNPTEIQANQPNPSRMQTDANKGTANSISKPKPSLPLRQWKYQKHFRPYVPVSVKAKVLARSLGRCEYVAATGKRCESKHFLEMEHQVPVARGGSHDLENLRIYCRAHNQLEAKLWGLSSNRN
jgi:5-methylcytosine-specific restriction endonuclease McrA